MDFIDQFISSAAANFWSVFWWIGPIPVPGPIFILIGTGFLLTIATKVIQVRKFFLGIKFTMLGAVRKDKSGEFTGDITPFQALMTSLSSTVGNGNIAGVATAIASGGPGAVFWMWITAVVGMATKYSEAVLAIHYRKIAEDGSMSGGPMYYIRRGFEGRPFLQHIAAPLAAIFAFFGAWVALFGTGNMMQTHSMAFVFNQEMHVPYWITGLTISILVGAVIIGGIKRIGKTAELLVPAMILLYFGSAIYILITNITGIPDALLWILRSAFTPQAAVGGFIGHSVKIALKFGIRRGLLSNESGLGSTPIAHAASKAKNPVRQGMIAMFDTFIDTLVVCTITALVILLTKAYHAPDPEHPGLALTSSALTAHAFSSSIPWAGGKIVALSSALFGYSTLIGWYYYGERCFEYLFGLKTIKYYKVIYLTLAFIGANLQGEHLQIVWDLGDLSNGFMAVPNLIGLICLTGMVHKITDEYIKGNKV